ASAQEMVRRGWITQDQLSSLFPSPEQGPTPRETMLVGLGDHYTVPDADEDWYLPLSDEEDTANVVPAVAWAQPDRTDEQMLQQPDVLAAIPVLAGAASTPPFAAPVPAVPVGDGAEAHRGEREPDRRGRAA